MPRRSQIDASPHKSEIEHLLIDLRWGSRTVAKYLETKYGEVIPDSSMRTWRQRRLRTLERQGKVPKIWREAPPESDNSARAQVLRHLTPEDTLPDVLTRRIALARLQEARVRLDAEHEFAMGKQFASQGREIDLLNRIYDSIKTDMQELGMLPTLEKQPETQVTVHAQGGHAAAIAAPVPADRTVEQLTHGIDPSTLSEAGRTLVLLRGSEKPDDA